MGYKCEDCGANLDPGERLGNNSREMAKHDTHGAGQTDQPATAHNRRI